MKKTFTTLFIIFYILAAAATSYAIDLPKMMHDSLARGYFEAAQGNRIQSKKHFRKAFDLARKTRNWSVMIDSAGGLLALGEREDATEYFDKIANLNKGIKDWRANVALAYNYLSYPKDFIENEKAAKSLEDAIKYASEKNDWRGLVETSKVLYDTESKERALECLESAKSIGMKSKNYEAMAEIASGYKKMGESQKSQETIRLYEEYKGQFGQVGAYPENFNPYGETVTAPKKINTESQIAERESADKEITAKIDYLAKLKELDKKEKDYYLTYDYYYDYPYYRRFYSNYGSATYLPPDWLGEWANFHLRHYNLVNGNYLFLGW